MTPELFNKIKSILDWCKDAAPIPVSDKAYGVCDNPEWQEIECLLFQEKKEGPREITIEEAQSIFVDSVKIRISSCQDKETLAHSILALIDGCSAGAPQYLLIPNPHPEDKEFMVGNYQNYYPQASLDNSISGELHEMLFQR